MTLPQLTEFLMWCTLLNGGVLILASVVLIAVPGPVYRLQHRWVPISRDAFNVATYASIGCFKILFLVFNLVPYLALRIMG